MKANAKTALKTQHLSAQRHKQLPYREPPYRYFAAEVSICVLVDVYLCG